MLAAETTNSGVELRILLQVHDPLFLIAYSLYISLIYILCSTTNVYLKKNKVLLEMTSYLYIAHRSNKKNNTISNEKRCDYTLIVLQ